MIIAILGPTGIGKSTIAAQIAAIHNWKCYDFDEQFPQEYRDRNLEGEVVPPEDVYDYQVTMVGKLLELETESPVVMAGFFLDSRLPDYLNAQADQIIWINLVTNDKEMLEKRIRSRPNHFAGIEVMEANWNIRHEQVIGPILVNGGGPIETVVENCCKHIPVPTTA